MEKQMQSHATDNQPSQAMQDEPRVVVRFRKGIGLDGATPIGAQIERSGIGPWRQLNGQFPDIELRPVFTHLDPGKLRELTQRAMEMDPTYEGADFGAFYYADTPPNTDLVALAKSLLAWNSVESAYIDQGAPDPHVMPSDDPRFVDQGYLDPAPDGIDAEYAWGFAGSDGAGVRLIDLERGWTLNHEDLATHGALLLHGANRAYSRHHGTAVLGAICAVDNTIGCVGIAPRPASVNVVSLYDSSRVDAILAAITNLGFGDILLLEAQVLLNDLRMMGPMEAYDAEFEAIRLATALGIVVVEVGGNGTFPGRAPELDMDVYRTLGGRAILHRDPANPDFRDSGAIIVSAATSAAPHYRLPHAPHGKRIDCYAWGENITTLYSDELGATNRYTSRFGGTSGAAAIVAGAALAVQGRANKLDRGMRFSPGQIRAILSDPALGTPAAADEPTRIGVMPNLRAIFDTVLNSAPDVYARDFVGDVGDPHGMANPSKSPDIIPRRTPVASAQAAFGEGSGTENDDMLAENVELGHDNYVYVRARNRGATDALGVQATVYWSPVSTLVRPDLWTLVGTATLPDLPVGGGLIVSPAIVWDAARIPAPDHYCFVALVGNAADPAPEPADFVHWDNFVRFVQRNNNVAWRNFWVVDPHASSPDTTAPAGFVPLPFLMPGAPDIARDMDLEVVLQLPQGGAALLEVPLAFYDRLKRRNQVGNAEIDKQRQVARIPLNPHGRTYYGGITLRAKSRAALRLLVHVPEAQRDGRYSVAARQIWHQQEVGRVTWLLQPEDAPDPAR
ncbi:S8 family serine peptidase [[Empedobacter] haloabium]|uniref:S8 family serine peptidase n=1 Tax=[Empedobacter] haloabium TaxID=592317 RepID=A0ABZ1UWD8_9BURK